MQVSDQNVEARLGSINRRLSELLGVAELPLANPDVCVHVPGREEFCDNFVATLTPPAPTATATGTATPTVEGPDETPTPTPTDTEEPGRIEVYLPIAANDAEIGR